MKNKLPDLRNHLFATIEGLLDETNPLDIDRARAVADVAGKVIDSAKVEVDFMRVIGAVRGSGFIPEPESPALPGTSRRVGQDR